MPTREQRIKKVALEAIQLKTTVWLYVKGFRPMYDARSPRSGIDMWFPGTDSDGLCPAVAEVCAALHFDILLIHRVFEYYRTEEFLVEGFDRETVGNQISLERKQIITNLLPFISIQWARYSGSTGETTKLQMLQKEGWIPRARMREIRIRLKVGSHAHRSSWRRMRRKEKERKKVS